MEIDPEIHDSGKSFFGKTFFLGLAVLVALLALGGIIWLIFSYEPEPKEIFMENNHYNPPPPNIKKEEWQFKPGPISMDDVKKKGCVADGFLSGYGGKTEDLIEMINRSECAYLHRALETWLEPPDFGAALGIMEKITKKPIVYGMFIAEAISVKDDYVDKVKDKDYHFDQMCRVGTENKWGEHTCVPSISSPEYRRYLLSITERAMDIGIQSFMFGQMQLQDDKPTFEQTDVTKVIDKMREYAKKKNMQIIIGAQTNSITDEKYLKLFDYIEGGVGINSLGNIENGPCSSKFSSCWALLWNNRYKAKANNVLVHLDWSGLSWDDMGVFARMTDEKRIATLKKLHTYFNQKGVGFLMPFLAVLNHDNNGCWGPTKNFYAPSNKYKCKDEDAINKIMKEAVLVK